jgi:hypothetical protein
MLVALEHKGIVRIPVDVLRGLAQAATQFLGGSLDESFSRVGAVFDSVDVYIAIVFEEVEDNGKFVTASSTVQPNRHKPEDSGQGVGSSRNNEEVNPIKHD